MSRRSRLQNRAMNKSHYLYEFELDDGNTIRIPLRVNQETVEAERNIDPDKLPSWTKMDFHQCGHCPLAKEGHCPAAVAIYSAIDCFSEVLSFSEVTLKVKTVQRDISRRTSVQRALSSLLGLLLATSGCPYTKYLKPLARFHLPLQSEQEAYYRMASMYALSLMMRKDKKPEEMTMQGLKNIFDNMHQVNLGLSERIKNATHADSANNALIILDLYTVAIKYVEDDLSEELGYLFTAYGEADQADAR